MKKNMLKKLCAGVVAAAMTLSSLPTKMLVFADDAKITMFQTVGNVQIELTADLGVFPEGAVLDVQEINTASEVEQIEAAVQQAISSEAMEPNIVEKTISYDIRVLDELGNELQPDTSAGSVQVAFSNIENENKTLGVYHVDDALTTAEPVASLVDSDGKIEISPEHFSIYVITVSGNSTQIKYYKGSTAATSYFMIYTAQQLMFFKNIVNGAITGTISVVTEYADGNIVSGGVDVSTLGTNAKLMNDIDLNPGTTFDANGTPTGNPATWVPIGLTTGARYGGTFNGDGHTISNLYIPTATNSNKMGVGFFGWLCSGACIKNLTIDGVVNVDAFTYVGGIVGYATSSTITNCTNNAYVVGSSHVGGIVGYGNGTIYEDCVNNGTIKAVTNNVGGIAGALGDGSAVTTTNIEHCSNNASITSTTSSNVGGLVGYVTSEYVSILNSYNTGAINGISYIGGLVGYSKGKVYNSYNQGIVTADSYAGGICGYSDTTGAIYGAYNSGNITTTYNVVGGIVGNNRSPMQYVYNTAKVTATSGNLAGGIVGSNYANFSYGYNTGDIKAFYHVGGIAGALQQSGVTLSYCYAEGKAISIANHPTYYSSVGGIVGYSEGTINSTCEANVNITMYNGASGAANGVGSQTVIGILGTYYAGMVLGYSNATSVSNGKYNSALSMPTVVSVMSNFSNTSSSYKNWTSTGGSASAPIFLNSSPAVVADIWTSTGNYADSFADGDGSESNPYQIATPAQLARLAYLTSVTYVTANDDLYLTRNYKLTADIDLSAHYWNPIGYKEYDFKGVFDGNSHTISGLTNKPGEYICGGFFCSNSGTIKNIVLTGVAISGAPNDGLMGVISRKNTGTIDNVNVSGSLTLTSGINAGVKYGGIVGTNAGTIINTISQVNITTTHNQSGSLCDYVGGITGDLTATDSKIYNSAATGKIVVVTGVNFSSVGGIAGEAAKGYLRNCYYYNANSISNTGSSGFSMTGGITARAGNVVNYYYTNEAKVLSDSSYLGSGTEHVNYNKLSNPISLSTSTLNTSDPTRTGYLTWKTLTSFEAPVTTWIDAGNYASAFADGDGTVNNPYQIATAAQFARLAYLSTTNTSYLSKNYVLTADINLSAHRWVSIGGGGVMKTAFSGTLDGNGKTISGFNATQYGLFYQTTGTLKNLIISGGVMTFTASGGMIAASNNGLIDNVRVLGGSVTATISGVNNSDVGGLVGGNSSAGTIINCICTANVKDVHSGAGGTGQDKIGGIAGYNGGGKIINCGVSGNIISDVTSSALVGGITGGNISSNSVVLLGYFSGSITNYEYGYSYYKGGVVGYNCTDSVVNYLYYSTSSSVTTGTNNNGGTSSYLTNQIPSITQLNDRVTSYSSTYPTKKWQTMTSFVETDSKTWIDAGNYASAFASGDGSVGNPYQIATPAQLARLAYLSTTDETYLTKNYILTADIDLLAHLWISIGGSVQASQKTFSGTFNGNDKSITGLTSNVASGLFAANSGTIKNLKLNAVITGTTSNYSIGALSNENTGTGTINNIILTGSISITCTSNSNMHFGGAIANNLGKIVNVISQVNMTSNHTLSSPGSGGDHVGGISGTNVSGSAGQNAYGAIYNCATNGIKIIATTNNHTNSVGGIVGTNYGPIRNCYFIGTIDNVTAGTSKLLGGIAGNSNDEGTIMYYYNSSAVTPIAAAKNMQPYVTASTAMTYSTLLNELNTKQTVGRDGFLTWATLTSFVPVTNTTVNVTLNGTNISGDGKKLTGSGSTYTGTASPASAFVTTLIANAGYKCPANINVTIGGASYTSFSYNAVTGELTIPAAAITGNIVITASATPISYTVVYHSGGTGAPSLGTTATTAEGETAYRQTVSYGSAANFAAQGAMTAAGWSFGGWATSAEATSATYSAGASIGNLTLMDGAEVHLYAYWTVTGGSAAYPISLQNGSFETPVNSGFYCYYTGATSGSNPNSIYWRTTASDNKIEFGSVKGGFISSATSAYHTSAARDGYQFAELNANLVGALYQDVSTIPGSTLYYGFSHKARSGTETMDLWLGSPAVIDQALAIYKKYTTGTTVTTGSGKRKTTTTTTITLAEAKAQIAALPGLIIVRDEVPLGNYTDWKDVSGNYNVPTGQSTTRFAFVSWSSPASNSCGNLLDNVYFSRSKPAKTANVIVRTTLGGYVIVNDSSASNTTVNSAATPYDKSLVYGTSLKLTVAADSGYTFNGGYINGTLYQSKAAFLTACNNMTWTVSDTSPNEITILFSKDSTISFALQGGSYNLTEKTLNSRPDNSYTLGTPTRDGYVFKGWTIAGTNTVLESGKTVTYNTAGNGATTLAVSSPAYSTATENGMILIANWEIDRTILPDVKISFVDGDYTTTPVTFTSLGTKTLNNSTTNYGIVPTATKTNYIFDSWYCGLTDAYYSNVTAVTYAMDGSNIPTVTVSYGSGQTATFKNTSEIIFEAVWNPKYTVAYNGNAVAGMTVTNVPSTQTCTYGVEFSIASALTSSLSYYRFNGWNTKADGTGTSYVAGESASNLALTGGSTVNLYAQWELTDTTAPSLKISNSMLDWDSFSNSFTFSDFYNLSKIIALTAADAGSGIKTGTLKYYIDKSGSLIPLSMDALSAAPWTDYDPAHKPTTAIDSKYVVYAIVSDNAGNTTIVNSNGFVIDTVSPVITGVENGSEIIVTNAVPISVTDVNLKSVIVYTNGSSSGTNKTVSGTSCSFTLPAPTASSTVYRIVATDKANNTSEITVTLVAATYGLAITAPEFADVFYGYVGASSKPVKLKSTGNSSVVVTNVALSGADAGKFTLTSPAITPTIAPTATDTQYLIKPVSNLVAGIYTAVVTATCSDGKTVSDTVSFTVKKKILEFSWSAPTTFTYDGTLHGITATPTNLVGADTVNVVYANSANNVHTATNSGSYNAVVTGITGNANYTVTGSTTALEAWSIGKNTPVLTPNTNSISMLDDGSGVVSYDYSGDGVVTATSNNTNIAAISISNADKEITITPQMNGTATITLSAPETSNYTSATAELVVTVYDGKLIVATGYDEIYDAASHNISVSANIAGATVTYSTDNVNFTATNPTEINVTETPKTVYYKVTASNGSVLATGSQTVNIRKKTLTVTPNDETIAYGEPSPSYSVSFSGFAGSENVAVITGNAAITCGYTTSSDVGEYDITAISDNLSANNYGFTFEKGTLTVTPRALTFNWEATTEFEYDGEKKTIEANPTNLVNGDEITVVCIDNAQINAGSYTAQVSEISGEKSGNYTLTNASRAWEITPATNSFGDTPLTMPDAVYGDEFDPDCTALYGTPIYTYCDTDNGTFTEEKPINVGTYYVKAMVPETSNYRGLASTAPVEFNIIRRKVSIIWGNLEFNFNGLVPTVIARAGNLVNDDMVTLTVQSANSSALGTYTAIVTQLSDPDNYELPANCRATYVIKNSYRAPSVLPPTTKPDEILKTQTIDTTKDYHLEIPLSELTQIKVNGVLVDIVGDVAKLNLRAPNKGESITYFITGIDKYDNNVTHVITLVNEAPDDKGANPDTGVGVDVIALAPAALLPVLRKKSKKLDK